MGVSLHKPLKKLWIFEVSLWFIWSHKYNILILNYLLNYLWCSCLTEARAHAFVPQWVLPYWLNWHWGNVWHHPYKSIGHVAQDDASSLSLAVDWLTDRSIDQSIDRSTERPTNRATDGPTDRPTDRQRQTGRQTNRPTDRSIDRSIIIIDIHDTFLNRFIEISFQNSRQTWRA